MNTTQTLPAGTIAQYRKVGQVRVLAHVGGISDDSPVQQYRVEFLTGRYAGQGHKLAWLSSSPDYAPSKRLKVEPA